MFDICTGRDVIIGNTKQGNIPLISHQHENNGISCFVERLPHRILFNHENTLSLADRGVFLATTQSYDFHIGTRVKAITFKNGKRTENVRLFFVTAINKLQILFTDYLTNATDSLPDLIVSLPTTKSNEVDFDYMENYIQSIVNEALFDMGKFIEKQALLDCILTEKEKNSLKNFDEDRVRMAKFKIGDLFDKVELKKCKFNKRKDTSEQKSVDFSIPLANAKHGNNGIMFYGKSDVFDSVEMTIDIVQNGAVATGDVYPQPQKTGVLWDAYLIKAKNRKGTENTLFYFSSSILKSIKQKYSYENKATWERVQNEEILLPITSKNEIDYDFMENYIMAQKKLAMKDVVQYADRKIAATKQVIDPH